MINWETNVNTLNCEFCNIQFNTKNIRTNGRLCPQCDSVKGEMAKVLNGKPYTQATQAERIRIIDRVRQMGRKKFNV